MGTDYSISHGSVIEEHINNWELAKHNKDDDLSLVAFDSFRHLRSLTNL